jgi:transcriptional regulator
VQQLSRDVLKVEEGSLYPALHRIELEGWITAEWGVTENNRRARYYRLTAAGRRQLRTETQRWEAIADAMATILREA